MEQLKDRINELKPRHYLDSAFYTEENHDDNNFDTLEFYPPRQWFKINGLEPDALLMKRNGSYALFIECKSGHVKGRDVTQAEKYAKLKLHQVKDLCKSQFRQCGIHNMKYDIAFQYYAEMLSDSEIGKYAKKEDVNKLTDLVSIISCDSANGLYKLWEKNKRDIQDKKTMDALKKGIQIPKKPDEPLQERKLLPPDLSNNNEYLAQLIITLEIFEKASKERNVILTPQDLKEGLFGKNKQPGLEKIVEILEQMRKIGICSITRETEAVSRYEKQYTFKSSKIIKREALDPIFRNKTLKELIANKRVVSRARRKRKKAEKEREKESVGESRQTTLE